MDFQNFLPETHIQNLVSKQYYKDIVLFRDLIQKSCDTYFHSLNAPRVNLYLLSKSVSSPIGLGSDSKPIKFELDKKEYFLSDSSQFGMEPLVINSFEMVYCYLPSFRGEEPDERHLTQFYHCEAELRGDCQKAMSVAENLVKSLINSIVKFAGNQTFLSLRLSLESLSLIMANDFPKIIFDEAVSLLEKNGYKDFIRYEKFGRVLSSKAENIITKLVGKNKMPVWVTNYDRDTVAFYQKPDPKNQDKVLNADLLFPPLCRDSFGGEILGLGQRQDNPEGIIESLKDKI